MLEKLLQKEGLVIAAGTMLLYTSVYFFERGYCSRLNIPIDYIDISIPTIANDVLYLVMFFFPIVVTSLAIMAAGERHEFKGIYALSRFYCGVVYSVVIFYYMEHTWINAGGSLFLGTLFIFQITPPDKNVGTLSRLSKHHSTIIRYTMAVFLVSITFSIYGNSYATGSSFDTYTQNGKKYQLLKVYGENVFMREVVSGKGVNGVTYFNAKNMTGMTLSHGE